MEKFVVRISIRADAREATTISSDFGKESEAREKAMRLRKSSQYTVSAVTTKPAEQVNSELLASIGYCCGPRKAKSAHNCLQRGGAFRRCEAAGVSGASTTLSSL